MAMSQQPELNNQKQTYRVSLLESLIPVVVLMVFLILSVTIYGDDTQSGASQMSLLISAGGATMSTGPVGEPICTRRSAG